MSLVKRMLMLLAMAAMVVVVAVPAMADDVIVTWECDLDGDGWAESECWDVQDLEAWAADLGLELEDVDAECVEWDDDGDGNINEDGDGDGEDDDGDGEEDEDWENCEEVLVTAEFDEA